MELIIIFVVFFGSLIRSHLATEDIMNSIALEDILSEEFMPTTLLMLENPKPTNKFFNNTNEDDAGSQNKTFDGTLNSAMDTMGFHRSMMNQYLCRSFLAEQIVGNMSTSRIKRRMGHVTVEIAEPTKSHTDITKNLIYDEGSSGYKDWLSKSATLEDIYRHYDQAQNKVDVTEEIDDGNNEDFEEGYNVGELGKKQETKSALNHRHEETFFSGSGYPESYSNYGPLEYSHPSYGPPNQQSYGPPSQQSYGPPNQQIYGPPPSFHHSGGGYPPFQPEHQVSYEQQYQYHEPEHHSPPTKYHVYNYYTKDKDLADLFEIALTALAFLAFKMFIVHVIMCITSVTNNATTTTLTMAMSMSPTATGTGMTELPMTGDDMPSTGGDMPGTGGDMPGTGGDMPSIGGDMPSTGDAMPSTGGDMPSTGDDMPSTGGDMSNTGDDMPGTGGDMPSTGGDMPSTGGNMQSTGGDMPSTGGDMPGTGGDMPSTGGDMPSTGGSMPNTGSDMTSTGGDMPSTGGDMTSTGGTGGDMPSTGGDMPSIGDGTGTGGGMTSTGGLISTGGGTAGDGSTGSDSTEGTGSGVDVNAGIDGSAMDGTAMDDTADDDSVRDTLNFRFKRSRQSVSSNPENEIINEMARKILIAIESSLVAHKDDGVCLRRSLCETNKWSRTLEGRHKLFIPLWSLGMSWLSGRIVRNVAPSTSMVDTLKASILGLGKANCEIIYQKCDLKGEVMERKRRKRETH